MKIKFLFFWSVFLISSVFFAQDCRALYGKYHPLYDQGKYTEAFTAWKQCYDQNPSFSKNIYIQGPVIIEGTYKATSDVTKREELKNLLVRLFEDRLKYFPDAADQNYVLANKVYYMFLMDVDTDENRLKQFKLVFDKEGTKLPSLAILGYFQQAKKMLESNKIKDKDLFDIYDDTYQAVENNMNQVSSELGSILELDSMKTTPDQKKEIARLNSIKENLNYVQGTISYDMYNLLTCQRITNAYQPEFNTNKTNADWLQRVANLLSQKECTDSDLFVKITQSWTDMHSGKAFANTSNSKTQTDATAKPSSNTSSSSLYRALTETKKGNYTAAVALLKNAIEGESNPIKKGEYYYYMAYAYFKARDFVKAVSFSNMAASFKKGWGDPYILVAQSYAQQSNACARQGKGIEQDFYARAVYWAAADAAAKAKRLDTRVQALADKLIKSYNAMAPQSDLIFKAGKKQGQSVSLTCLGTSITVR